MLNWLCNLKPININIAFASLVVSLAVLTFSAYHYLRTRSAEIKQERFENYHNIIDKLVEAVNGKNPKLDSQIAKIYELRNYREYREVSIRILEGLKKSWENEEKKDDFKQLIDETKISLSKLKKIVWPSYITRILDFFTSYK